MMIGQRRPAWDQMGMEAAPAALDVPQFTMPAVTAPAKPKLNWGAIIADALSGLAGQPGQYPQRMARERAEQTEFERGEQRYQRQRADSRDDFLWRQQNEVKAPQTWEGNNGDRYSTGPDGNPIKIWTDPSPKERWVFDPVRGYVNINDMMPAPSGQPRRFDTLPQGAVPLPNGGAGSASPRGFR